MRAVILVDTDGVVSTWTDGAEALFGYPAADAVGRPVDFLVPPAHRDAHWKGFRRAMSEPTIKDMAADLPVLCADGQVRHFAGRLLALSDGLGVAVGAVAIYSDDSTGFRPFG